MSKFSIGAVMTAAAICVGAAPAAHAETALRYSHYGPDKGIQSGVLGQFATDVKSATNGELDVQIIFGGALVGVRDMARGVGTGVADLGTLVAVMTPKELFNFRVADLPVGSTDPYVGISAISELARTNETIRGEFDRLGLKLLASFSTTEVLLNCKEPLTSLDQLQGMKIRANPPHSKAFEKFGATIVSLGFPDVYQALDRGNIACAQTYITAIVPYRHYEVAKHVTTLDFGQNLAFGMVMNKQAFDALPAEQQQALIAAGDAASMKYARDAIEIAAKFQAKIESETGVSFYALSDAEKARLDEAGESTVEEFIANGDAQVLQAYRDLTAKYEEALAKDGYPWAAK